MIVVLSAVHSFVSRILCFLSMQPIVCPIQKKLKKIHKKKEKLSF